MRAYLVMGEDIYELNTKNRILGNKAGDHNQKWIEKTIWKTV